MDWKKLSRKEKISYLSQQLEDIQKAQATIERFVMLTDKWLKRMQRAKKKK
jgi:ABC-type Mn2+/Zn2+ transport system ATPase subunit